MADIHQLPHKPVAQGITAPLRKCLRRPKSSTVALVGLAARHLGVREGTGTWHRDRTRDWTHRPYAAMRKHGERRRGPWERRQAPERGSQLYWPRNRLFRGSEPFIVRSALCREQRGSTG